MQKLDSFSKILLATGTINYMAASVDSLNQHMRYVQDPNGWHKEGIEEREKVLAETVEDLKKIMNRLGDIINAHDSLSAVDQYVTTPTFNVVVHGHDEVEGDFDEL